MEQREGEGQRDPMPIDAMTDEERDALAEKYRQAAAAHEKHAEELERYLVERTARDTPATRRARGEPDTT